MILTTAEERRELLAASHTVAMVGASANPLRPSYFVFRYLRTHGFDVRPVNPDYKEVDGVRCFASLADYARELGPPDIVDVFRKADETPQVARDAVAAGAKAIWFQYGVINDEAIRIADDAGLARRGGPLHESRTRPLRRRAHGRRHELRDHQLEAPAATSLGTSITTE